MKKLILISKSRLIVSALKVLGLCGVLIMFEACYGPPKSGYIPKHESKQQNNKEVNGTANLHDSATANKNKANQ